MSTWLELVTLIWPGKSSWRYTQILHWTMEKWEVLSSWRSRNKLKFPVRKELGNFSQFKNHWARTKVLFDHLRLSGEILGDVSYLIHVNCHSPPQKNHHPLIHITPGFLDKWGCLVAASVGYTEKPLQIRTPHYPPGTLENCHWSHRTQSDCLWSAVWSPPAVGPQQKKHLPPQKLNE